MYLCTHIKYKYMNELTKEQAQKRIFDWFNEDIATIKRKNMLSISKIEKVANMPKNTLNFFLNNIKYRNIYNHLDSLIYIIEFYGFKL